MRLALRFWATTTRMKKMGEMGRKRRLDDLYGKLLRLHLHCIWPRHKPYGLIARARGKGLPGPAHGLEPAAQQLRSLIRTFCWAAHFFRMEGHLGSRRCR